MDTINAPPPQPPPTAKVLTKTGCAFDREICDGLTDLYFEMRDRKGSCYKPSWWGSESIGILNILNYWRFCESSDHQTIPIGCSHPAL